MPWCECSTARHAFVLRKFPGHPAFALVETELARTRPEEPACSLMRVELHKMDAAQRRMLWSTVGWTRLADEPCRATMHRMTLRVKAAIALYPKDPWTTRVAMRQHGFASHVAETRSWHVASEFPCVYE